MKNTMNHIKDENGAYKDCYAYPGTGKYECRILKDWYKVSERRNRCAGCPFFKTRERAAEDAKKYPPMEDYKNRR